MESNRYYGLYRGICWDNQDPDNLNKIIVKVPQILHDNTVWANPCLPVATNANHPDHVAHLASDVAALLTTSPSTTGSSGPSSHSHSIPALTIVAKSGDGTLTHPHVTSDDPLDTYDTEHTLHRKVPNINQVVWVMFEGGDPNFPVWIGVM